jgi:hypothetical protein
LIHWIHCDLEDRLRDGSSIRHRQGNVARATRVLPRRDRKGTVVACSAGYQAREESRVVGRGSGDEVCHRSVRILDPEIHHQLDVLIRSLVGNLGDGGLGREYVEDPAARDLAPDLGRIVELVGNVERPDAVGNGPIEVRQKDAYGPEGAGGGNTSLP